MKKPTSLLLVLAMLPVLTGSSQTLRREIPTTSDIARRMLTNETAQGIADFLGVEVLASGFTSTDSNNVLAASTNLAKTYTDAAIVVATNGLGAGGGFSLTDSNNVFAAATNQAKTYTDAQVSMGTNVSKLYTDNQLASASNNIVAAATNVTDRRWFFSAQDQNLNFPNSIERKRAGKSLRILNFGDDAFGPRTIVKTWLDTFMKYNGSIGEGGGNYYPLRSADVRQSTLSTDQGLVGTPIRVYGMPDGSTITNYNPSGSSYILSDTITLNAWKLTGFGTLTIRTNNGTTEGTVAVVDTSGDATLTPFSTNWTVPQGSWKVIVNSTGTNYINFAGQYHSSIATNYLWDIWQDANGEINNTMTNSLMSNSFVTFATNFDLVIINESSYSNTAYAGSALLYQAITNRQAATDLLFFQPPPVTNLVAFNYFTREGYSMVARDYGLSMLDNGSLFLPIDVVKLQPYYLADGVHLSDEGNQLASIKLKGVLAGLAYRTGTGSNFGYGGFSLTDSNNIFAAATNEAKAYADTLALGGGGGDVYSNTVVQFSSLSVSNKNIAAIDQYRWVEITNGAVIVPAFNSDRVDTEPGLFFRGTNMGVDGKIFMWSDHLGAANTPEMILKCNYSMAFLPGQDSVFGHANIQAGAYAAKGGLFYLVAADDPLTPGWTDGIGYETNGHSYTLQFNARSAWFGGSIYSTPGIIGFAGSTNGGLYGPNNTLKGQLWFYAVTPQASGGSYASYPGLVSAKMFGTNGWWFSGTNSGDFSGATNVTAEHLSSALTNWIDSEIAGGGGPVTATYLTSDLTNWVRGDVLDEASFYLREEFFAGGNAAFQSGELGWRGLISGNGTPGAIASESQHPGIYRASTAASANSFSGMAPVQTGSTSGYFGANGDYTATFIFRPSTTNGTDVAVGFSSSSAGALITTASANGLVAIGGIYLVSTNGSNYYLHTRPSAGGTQAWSDTTVKSQDNVWVKAKFRWDSASSTMYCSVNGTSEVSVSGSAIFPGGSLLSPVFEIITSAASAVTIDMDFFAIRQNGLTR